MSRRPRRRRTFISASNSRKELPGLNTEDDFEENVESFIRTQKSKNLSNFTIKYYRNTLYSFMSILEKQGATTRLRRITGDMIEDLYVSYLLDVKRLKYTSIASGLRSLRAFFNWAKGRGIIEESPMKYVKISKPDSRELETFSREQIRELLQQPDLETFVGFRDYVIMIVLLETGIRLRELTDIDIHDIRWQDSQILIRGKNGEDRLVPFQQQTRRVLKNYLKVRGDSFTDALFISRDDDRISRKAIQDRISKYGRMANIKNVRCSPHTFRHTFAKMSVRNGADIFTLQKILGHKSLEMVRVYVNMFSSEVSEAHRKFSPVENLRI